MEIRRILGTSYSLGVSHFKLRNEGSYLGIFWYLLNPILMFILLLAIFSKSLGSEIENYPLYLLLGIIMFNFFQAVTAESTRVIRRDRGILRSIKFPQESLIGSTVLVAIFSHIFEMMILVVFLLVFKLPITGLLFYPLILVLFSLFSLGVSLVLSSIAVYIVDLDNLWMFGTKLLWFATPLFYEVKSPQPLYYLNLFNPLYYFITLSRYIVVNTELPPLWIIIGTLDFTLFSLMFGLVVFRSKSKKVAELI